MILTQRKYHSEADFWRIRIFLREVFLLNNRREFSWSVARLDYWRWHRIANMNDGRLEEDVYLWETGDGQIAAVLDREDRACIPANPSAYKTADLEGDDQPGRRSIAPSSRSGGMALWVWSDSEDVQRQNP
jgi:hypothetical protein